MTTRISNALRRLVTERAYYCCEYCRLHQSANFIPHEIDHVISEKHHGLTIENNLCLSCYDCNRFKGSDIGSHDKVNDIYLRLFHPRQDVWHEHFELQNALIQPLTAIARVTIAVLRMNTPEQVSKRTELINIQSYPCAEI